MEAAACYVGECSEPGKDAPRAIVGEALLAPILGVIFFIIWIVVGPLYAAAQGQGPAYWLGWVVLLTYVPLYYYRKRVEDRRAVPAPPATTEEAPTRLA